MTDRLTLAIGHAVLAHAVYSGRTWTALALGIVVGIHAHLVWRRWQR